MHSLNYGHFGLIDNEAVCALGRGLLWLKVPCLIHRFLLCIPKVWASVHRLQKKCVIKHSDMEVAKLQVYKHSPKTMWKAGDIHLSKLPIYRAYTIYLDKLSEKNTRPLQYYFINLYSHITGWLWLHSLFPKGDGSSSPLFKLDFDQSSSSDLVALLLFGGSKRDIRLSC